MEMLVQFAAIAGPVGLAAMGIFIAIKPPARVATVQLGWAAAFLIIGVIAASANFLEIRRGHALQKAIHAGVDQLLLTPGRVARRSLSNPASEKLVAFLRPFAATSASVEPSCLVGDAEGCRFAQELATALRIAGWRVNGVSQIAQSPPATGLHIGVRSPETPGAGILQRALAEIGVEAQGEEDEAFDPGAIRLHVGSKT